MCRYRLSSLIAFVLVVLPLAGVNAQSETVKSLTDVTYVGTSDRIEFSFLADEPLKVEDLSARTQGSLLVLRLENAKTSRRWISIADASVKRVLVHASKKRAPAANLRIRFHKKVDSAVVRNIRVRSEGGRVIAAVPRNAKVALAWEGANVQPEPQPLEEKKAKAESAPVQTKPIQAAQKAESVPTKAVVVEKKTVTTEAQQAVNDDKSVEAVPANTEESQALEAPSEEDIAIEVDESQPLVSNEMADGIPEGPGMGAVAMSFLLVLVVGLFLWRRMRKQSGQAGTAPMIRTVGSHMLGPKQGLLLVDVAGEMVLLGTSDKGVQLLTKIESPRAQNEQSETGISQLVESVGEAVPANAMGLSERMSNGLGKVIDRIRQQAAAQSGEDVGATGEGTDFTDPVDTYRALVNGARQSAARQRLNPARRDFAPVAPAKPKRLDEIEPPLNSSDDLLNKLRNLQSA